MVVKTFESSLLELEKTYAKVSTGKAKIEKCLTLVESMKEMLAKKNMDTEFMNKDYLLKLRTFLELSSLIYLELNDTDSFKCVYSQLHPLYFDFNHLLDRSPKMNVIVSTWMLHLLSENKIGDLYMLLEKLPEDLRKDEKITFVTNLERLMMEGDLGKLLDLNDNTNEYYKIIASTSRNKIASSIELSYKELQLDYITKILKLKNENELMDFITYYNQYKLQLGIFIIYIKIFLDPDSLPWKIVDNLVVFQNESVVKHKIPSKELLHNSLEYLNDLEKIV